MGKLFVKSKEIRHKRNVAKMVKESGGLCPEDIAGDISVFLNFYNLKDYPLDKVCRIVNLYYLKSETVFNYIKISGLDNFDEGRFLKYLEYRKENRSDCFSKKYFQLVHGDNWENYMKQRIDAFAGKIYDPSYIAKKHNLSLEDAERYIDNFKKSKATSKENFLKKHGDSLGEELFQKFQETSKHSRKKYIEKYGVEEGLEKWKNYVNLKRKTSPRSLEYWLEKYPDPEEAREYQKKFHRENFNSSSVAFWMNRGMTELEAIQKVSGIFAKKRVHFGSASKESLKYFKPLYDYLTHLGKKVWLGIEDSQEKIIYHQELKKAMFFDFCLEDEKLIIEFNGWKFHPDKEKLSEEEWNLWRCPEMEGSPAATADEVWRNDLEKQKLAEEKGYKYLVIWSNDSKEKNAQLIINFFEKNKITLPSLIFS